MALFMFIVLAIVLVVVLLVVRSVLPALGAASGAAATIQNGIPSVATVESVSETGATITSSWTGPDAAVLGLTLLVNPTGGGQPYQVAVQQAVPRIARSMIVPGAAAPVLIDPLNRQRVQVDWRTLTTVPPSSFAAVAAPPISGETPASAPFIPPGAAPAAGVPGGGFTMTWDASGRPTGDVNSVAAGVHSGTLNTIQGSADQLLAAGTHGIAVITTAQPLGKLVRDMNPNAKPERLDYPMWLFTVEVTLPGQAPFPAIFGHYVPTHRVALLGPGVKLAVSVNEADRNEDVAIDWDRSPLPPGA